MQNTFFLIAFLYFSYFWGILNPIIRNAGIVLYCIQSFAYFMTSILNPGIPRHYFSKNLNPIEYGTINSNEVKFCKKCNILHKPNQITYHCDQCKVCIEGFL